MLDRFERRINYLRISVTDRCNLRCIYCMPEQGIKLIDHNSVLSFEEITEFTKYAVELGINKVRLTGGEPLVRKRILYLVEMISAIKGIDDFSMTTNGILLSKYAEGLKNAGLHRINISLDTIDPEKFREMTRGGNIDEVLNGIHAAVDAGLKPIKINCVVKKSIEELDAIEVNKFCNENGLEARFIFEMDIEKGEFGVVHGGIGGDCDNCNRLRLTSDGFLKPCLLNDISVNIRTMDYSEAIRMAIEQKPACGDSSTTHKFYNIGG
ncbi:MAG: radical SAM protein [Melioribacteraceae bacterium]|nr:radical SAM protein [Melioribacteraceae bacterium]